MHRNTADLMDERDDLQSCEVQFDQFGGQSRFNGRVRTVQCFEDNLLVRKVLAQDGRGMVLVVDGGGSYRTALLGGQLAKSAVDHGWAGVIVNGCVRDAVELEALPIGIKALGTNPRRSAKLGNGRVDVPVSFGGVTFAPGAAVFSDEDGLVVGPSDD